MHRKVAATLAALALLAVMATPALARTAPQGGDSMFTVCRYSVAARLGLSPVDPRVVSYCIAWLNGAIVTPPNH